MIVVLGASDLQLPLIEKVKGKGFQVIVVSPYGKYPGLQIADKCLYFDIRDFLNIYEAIKGEKIEAILTDQTDMSVPTVAYLTEQLNLPGNKLDSAIVYSNKFHMRQACQKLGISVPNFIHVNNKKELVQSVNNITFPAIMKPEDNQGSRGIYKIYSIEDILNHWDSSISYSKTEFVIIEDFFEGKEVVVEGFVKNGEYLNWGIGDRKYFEISEKFIPSQTLFPSYISDEMKSKLIDAEIQLHKAIKPSFGMIHSEYLINEETKEYRLVETALRGGGVYISSHLIPLYTSVDNYEILLNCALGKNVCLNNIKKQFKYASSAYMCFYLPEGEIISIKGIDELKKIKEIKKMDLDNLKIGFCIHEIENKTMRLGPIIIGASSRFEIEKIMQKIKDTLKIKVRTIDGSLKEDVIWD